MTYNFVPEDYLLYDFKSNQHVLVEKEFIKNIRGYQDVDVVSKEIPDTLGQYPLVNSYYEYAEDYDAVNRVPHLLCDQEISQSEKENPESADYEVCSQDSNVQIRDFDAAVKPSFDIPRIKTQIRLEDYFTERKAQNVYLSTKPKCFIILGKPGLGEERLAKDLADYWKCVNIHPESLILDEIASGSRAGQCIEFNLRCGRAISVDVIIRLLEKILKSDIVQHRGFVLSGFPMIPNDLYREDPVSSESAIFNVHEIFEELFDTIVSNDTIKNVSPTSTVSDLNMDEESKRETSQEQGEEEESSKSEKDVLIDSDTESFDKPLCYQSQFYATDTNQMEFILSLCSHYDYMIVYLKCPNEEVVNIHKDNRMDLQTYKMINLQRERSEDVYYSLYNEVEINYLSDTRSLRQKHVRLQKDFAAHVRKQLEQYLLESQLVIEKYILVKEPQDIVKLDGRMAPYRLFQVLRMRLKILSFQPVVIPKPLIASIVEFEEAGEGMEKVEIVPEKYDDTSPEEALPGLCVHKIVAPLYKWNMSEWKYYCPVALKQGATITGLTKFAVHFMNKIYFLSSEKRLQKFINNPRPYLLPPMPNTIRKVFVIGPERSGKTAISRIIQHHTLGKILDCNQMLADFKNAMYYQFLDEVVSAARRKAMDNMKEMRKQAWLDLEAEIQRKINQYLNCIKQTLQEILNAMIKIVEYPYLDLTSLPSPAAAAKTPSLILAEGIIEKYEPLMALLGITTPEDVERFLNDDSLIIANLPPELQQPNVFTYDVVSTEAEYVKNFINEAIKKLEEDCISENVSPQFLARFLNQLIPTYNNYLKQENIYGWIIDGFPASPGVFQLLDRSNKPDMVYLITDSTNGKSLFTIASLYSKDKETKLGLGSDISNLAIKTMDITSFSFGSDSRKSQDGKYTEDTIEHYLTTIQPEIEEKLKDHKFNYELLDVGGIPFTNVLANLSDSFKAMYDPIAEVVSTEDKAREPYDYGDMDESGDEIEGESGGNIGPGDHTMAFLENRRLGNTADYDPVAFYLYNVLWKGKENYLARYMNKMWLFATQATMDTFIEAPHAYSKHKLYNVKLPPPRICVVGNKSIGKTTQARLLSKRLGLYYLNFETAVAKMKQSMMEQGEGEIEEKVKSEVNIAAGTSETILRDLLLPLWHDANKKAIGFILDGFPRRISDVEFMTRNFLIPDCVVELYMDIYALNARLFERLLTEWRLQIGTERAVDQERYDEEMKVWRERREEYKSLMLEERQLMRFSKQQAYEMDEEGSEEESLISYMSYQEAKDEEEIEATLEALYPEPVLNANWESEEDAIHRLQEAVEATTDIEPEFLSEIKMECEIMQISWHVIDAKKDIDKVYNLIMLKVMEYVFRNNSVFERAYAITIEMAEKLLEEGYYFLSRFGRLCPVQMYEYNNPIHMYLHHEASFEIFPMIYSNYIYFLAGVQNRTKFKKDILKYVTQSFMPLPLHRSRIAVIGPPRCGKTTIAERLVKEFGLEHISIRKAVTRILNTLPSSILARNIQKVLREGNEVPTEYVAKCIEAMTFEAKAVAIGYVTDGFPNNIEEVKHLAQMNLVPQLVFDLQATMNYVFEYTEFFGPIHKPDYPKVFIQLRFQDWESQREVFRNWIDREYQNLVRVTVSPSKWRTWTTVKEILFDVIKDIKQYYRFAKKDIPLRVEHMLVTPYEFNFNQTEFKYYCHWCLCSNNVLSSGGRSVDRSGLLSYRGKFYYLCNKHITDFEENPQTYLGEKCQNALPSVLPEPMTLTEIPSNVFFNGNCVVCFVKSKLDKIIVKGSLQYAIAYNDVVYMFDSNLCMREFEKMPETYAHVLPFNMESVLPSTDINSLPNLGFLEQLCANQVIKALLEVENVRPVVPGLDVGKSAVVCLGLVLKINNPNTPSKYLELYKKAKQKCMDFQEDIRKQIAEAKQTINPYLHYEEPLPPFEMDFQLLHKGSTDAMYIRDLINRMLDQIDYEESLLLGE